MTRSEDPAKLNVTVEPGFSVWKMVPISVNVAFSEAAANTVSVPDAVGRRSRSAADEESGGERGDRAGRRR